MSPGDDTLKAMLLSATPEKDSISWSRPLSYWACFTVLGLGMSILGPALPSLARNTGSSLGQASVLFLARSLGELGGSFLGGRLFDLFSGHRLLGISLVILAIGTAMTPLVPLLWLLALLFVILGTMESVIMVGVNALLLWLFQHRSAPYLNALHFSFGVGGLIGPALLGFFLGRGNFAPTYFLISAVVALMGVVMVVLPGSPSRGKAKTDTRRFPFPGGLLARFILFFLLYTGAEVGFSSWVFTYSITMGVLSETAAALLTSAFYAALTCGRLLAVPLSLHLKPQGVMGSGLLGGILSVLAILAWPHSATALWLGTLGLGLSLAPVFPAGFLFAQRLIPISAQVAGWFNAGGAMGVMLTPWLIGQLFIPLGPASAMITILLTLCLAFLLSVLVLSRLSRRPAPL
jgi:FHS family Na+ dependent glucose MFS transporter 1